MKRISINLPIISGFVKMSDAHVFFAKRRIMENEVVEAVKDLKQINLPQLGANGIRVLLVDPDLPLIEAEKLIEESKLLGYTLLVNKPEKPLSCSDFAGAAL